MTRNAVSAAAFVLLSAVTASAQVRAGQEFRINTYTAGFQAWGSPRPVLQQRLVS